MVKEKNGRPKEHITGMVFTAQDEKGNTMALGIGPELTARYRALPLEQQEEAEKHIRNRLTDDLKEAVLLLSVDIGIRTVKEAIR